MRILIIISFIISITSVAHAATCTATTATTCNKTAGCGWSTSCTPCPQGKYNPGGDNATGCQTCYKPTNATFNNAQSGLTDNSCPWTLTCAAGTYWNGATCASCGNNAISTQQTISGTGNTNMPATQINNCTVCNTYEEPNNDKTECECRDKTHYHDDDYGYCVPNIYKITLDKNGGNGGTSVFYYKYNDSVSLNQNSGFSPNISITTPTKTKHDFIGYYTDPNNGQRVIYSSTIKTSDLNRVTIQQDGATLYAHWEPLTYRISYKSAPTDTNKYDTTEQFGTQATALTFSATGLTAPQGKLFNSWQCTGCGNGQTTIKPGDEIQEPINVADNIILVANWVDCDAGYYCANNNQAACPAGSTSDARASAQTDCYMVGGTTKFCDKQNNCLTLPTNAGKIYYQKNQ